MYCFIVVCCVLCCVVVCSGQQCNFPQSSTFKFTVRSRRNQTGHWIAEMKLGHEAGLKEEGPWELDIDHTTAKCQNSESILIAATVTAPSSTKRVPSGLGYDLMPGFGYYKLHTDSKPWNEALTTCEQEGTHLLIVNSETEAKVLEPLWKNTSGNWAFIGIHDQFKEGEYITIFNDTLASTGFSKWYRGHPTGESFDCGLFGRSLVLADNPCTTKNMFICEFEL